MSAKIKATRAFREELTALLARHGMDLLVDDTLWLWRDDYTDSLLIYMRPTGWFADWRARHDTTTWTPVAEDEVTKEKADPVSEADLDIPSRHSDGWTL